LIPHGDIVGVITPINILFIGWRILIPREDKDDDYDDSDDDYDDYDDHHHHDHDNCKCGATSGLGRNSLFTHQITHVIHVIVYLPIKNGDVPSFFWYTLPGTDGTTGHIPTSPALPRLPGRNDQPASFFFGCWPIAIQLVGN
jgi:hypothetical protein